MEFQSTLPMRGATLWSQIYLLDRGISIHAPHAGSDLEALAKSKLRVRISIHAPHAGSDLVVDRPHAIQGISIHAPHAGSDLLGAEITARREEFQSTLPMRGATKRQVRGGV